MAIYLVRFIVHGKPQWGKVIQDKVFPLFENFPTLSSLLSKHFPNFSSLHHNEKEAIPIDSFPLLSPVTEPCQIICQGKNYLEHILETGLKPEDKDFNLFFTKASSCLNGPYEPVIRPKIVELLDYEVEMGIVIGRPVLSALRVDEENLHEYIAGIVLANDVSARDIQVPQKQWYKGKSFRTFCPVGPYLCILEKGDFPKISQMHILLKVNGEIRQKSHTSKMIYKSAETLSELSSIVNLWPGDLILSGTPGGVAFNMSAEWKKETQGMPEREQMKRLVEHQKKSSKYLKDGDCVESAIWSDDNSINLGIQRFSIISEL